MNKLVDLAYDNCCWVIRTGLFLPIMDRPSENHIKIAQGKLPKCFPDLRDDLGLSDI